MGRARKGSVKVDEANVSLWRFGPILHIHYFDRNQMR
jgi:hypothetical protein